MASSFSRRLFCLHWKSVIWCSYLHSFPPLDLLGDLLQLLHQHLLLYGPTLLLGKWLFFFLNLTHQPRLDWNFSSAPSSPFWSLIELKTVRVSLWIRIWLKGMLWLIWPFIQSTKTFSILAIRLLCLLIICASTGVALLISLKNFSSVGTPCQSSWLGLCTCTAKGPGSIPSQGTKILQAA